MIQFLHDNGYRDCSTRAINWVAYNGYLEIVKWLHENTAINPTNKALDNADGNGYMNIVEYLEKHCNIEFFIEIRHVNCSTKVMDVVAKYGHLDVVQ
ncbi:hypothetical protein THRCLA_21981 [Thraustotheca clavata]|uniref:Ankyrin repeat protein n=1 Tax=Thraustotheca clavata TaxID=74557 RepID=A0A1V9ZFN8_9STRA|nr:hypothetical protein THRCLA_21981 [Thraustotheca clavata]